MHAVLPRVCMGRPSGGHVYHDLQPVHCAYPPRLVTPDLLWRNRGFVLDGWPRTANAARCAFMRQEPLDEEDQAELAAEV